MPELAGACLISLLLFQAAHAQDFNFKLMAGVNGKPTGKINAITQDIHGYMWFAGNGERCLYRYDGATMVAFRHNESTTNSLDIENPETVFADDRGLIWTGGDGLDQFNPSSGEFKHFRHSNEDEGSLSGFVTSILRDHHGRLWVGTINGLDLLEEATGNFLHHRNKPDDARSISSNMVMKIYEDRSGTLWIGTGQPFIHLTQGLSPTDGGLNRLEADGKFTRYRNIPNDPSSITNNKVKAIFEDSRGVFWVGTAGDGLHIMDRSKGTFEHHPYNPRNTDALSRPPLKHSSDHITFINEDHSGAIWIGTYGTGIVRYDPTTKKITNYQNSHGFSDNSSWTGFISTDGVLWVATEDSNQLFRVDPFFQPVALSDLGAPASSYAEVNGDFWVGTLGAGIRKFDAQRNITLKLMHNPESRSGLSDNGAGLSQLGGDTLWVRTPSAFRILNSRDGTLYWNKEYGGLKDSAGLGISTIIRDGQGIMWFGTWGMGLVRFNPKDQTFRHYLESEQDSTSIASNYINMIYGDKSGTLWAGSPDGLNRVDKKLGTFKHYLPGNFINSLFEDSNGNFWCGTENGLTRYDPQEDRFKPFINPLSEISYAATGGITEDKAKMLWFVTLSGVVRFDPARNKLSVFAETYGIAPDKLQLWAPAFRNKKGELFFSNENGFYRITPESMKVKSDFNLQITGLSINAKMVKPGDGSPLKGPVEDLEKLDLSYNQNNLSFRFTAVDYRNPEARRFFTRLDHYDTTWREAVGDKSALYFNVMPGKYIFRVRAINHDGTTNEKQVLILIHPPWWLTWWAYSSYAMFGGIVIAAFVGFRTRQLRKEKKVLEDKVTERTSELKKEKETVEKTLSELTATQTQLIHSEKMASLGELTAGIAHEIQNPLNFVSNFSEVSHELLGEMTAELEKGNLKDAVSVAENVKDNLEKVLHHGKRADSIVKSMLQHSRTHSGKKELTDINGLVDEYLRLAYHGHRAKDKSLPDLSAGQTGFNARLETHFDPSVGLIPIIPQEIGRVILNLINNAFYAVTEKQTAFAKSQSEVLPKSTMAPEEKMNYQPTVTVSTKRLENQIELTISDNGIGIADKALSKIFQPFFTTKPSGQGTGLGLSLSYDIITKGHGGEIKVETVEGEGTTFVIRLPAMSKV